MPKYKYTALALDGSPVTGVVEGATASGAGFALLERDLEVTDLVEKKSLLQFEISKKKVARKDLMQFSRQLAVFLRAGISVLDALEVIRDETTKKTLAACLTDMIDAIRGGATFIESATAHPETFPAFYVGALEAAELTGRLDSVLDELAVYIGRDLEARRKIQAALFYPACVFLLSIVTVAVLVTFVLPRFQKFFEDLHAKLPLPTRMLLSVTHFFTHDWTFLVLALAAVAAVVVFGPRTKRGREIKDTLLLRLPVAGDMVRVAIQERFCRTFSSLVRAGVPMPDALAVTTDGTNNVVYARALSEARESMLRGEGLAGPIGDTGLFPGATRQMIRVGEETGTLGKQLETSAEYLEQELDFKIKRFTNLFEPAVIVLMGLMVGFVAVALVSAMYGIFRQSNLG
jgi:type IV pilus assembly protein PilC